MKREKQKGGWRGGGGGHSIHDGVDAGNGSGYGYGSNCGSGFSSAEWL